MSARIFIGFALLLTMPVWGQAGVGTSQSTESGDSSQMQTSPLISGLDYPTVAGSEERSNYLSGGLYLTTAYDDNVIGAGGTKPVSDVSYMIRPSISLNQTTPRQRASLSYSPGYMFYQPTSELDESTESLNATYLYRTSPHSSVSATETLIKSAGIFSMQDESNSGVVSGSPSPSPITAPYAEELTNMTSGGFSYQFGRNSMLGGTGSFHKYSYPDQTEAVGLANSSSTGGAAFFSERLGKRQYLGFEYSYERSLTYPRTGQGEVQGNTVTPFYSIFFGPAISISIAAGPQHVTASETNSSAVSRSWGPAVSGSMGIQGTHANFAASAMHMVSEGTGLEGPFQITQVIVAASWKASRNWSLGLSGNYQLEKNAATALTFSSVGGHSISGGAHAGRTLGRYLGLDFGYNRMHQAFAEVPSIAIDPDNNHVYVSISYLFTRPLGR
jgi:hypothetical protein